MTPTTMMIPLVKLLPGAKAPGGSINSRKADAPIDGLADSIATHGLLVPLLVRSDGNGAFYVIDGNRRLAAMTALVKKNNTMFVNGVLCIEAHTVGDRLVDALELSAVVNAEREELHPVDLFEVLSALVQHGMTVDALAKRYRMKPGHVRQALALGRMAPEVRDAWRAGKITDDVAEAFTVTTDHKAQAAALKRAGNTHSSWRVRNELLKDVDVGKMLKFVGRAAYEKAGFEINESLFSDRNDDVTVSDVGALKGMATRKLSDECDKLTGAGWKWAVIKSEAPKDAGAWKRVHPSTGKYTKEQMATLGCIVDVSHQAGAIHVEHGYLKPGDKGMPTPKSPKEKKAETAKREQQKEESGGLSNALAHRLSQQLTAAVRQAFTDGGVKGDDVIALTIAALACADGPTKIRLGTDADGHDGARHENEFSKYLKLAQGKTPAARLGLLAHWLAQSIDLTAHQAPALVSLLHPPKGFDRGARMLIEAIDPKVMNGCAVKHFDLGDYLASVSKELVVEAVLDSIGKDHADRVAKMKAADAKAYAAKHMAKSGWVPEALRI